MKHKEFYEDSRAAVNVLLIGFSVLTVAVWLTIALVLHFEF